MSDAISWKPPDYSDAGNAKVLVDEYSGILAFCDALGWLSWTGTHWEQNYQKAVEKAVDLTVYMISEAQVELDAAFHAEADAQLALAQDKEGAKEQLAKAKETVKRTKAYFTHATKSRNVARIRGMLELSKISFHITADRLDADPFALSTPEGIVDLQTGEIKPHSTDSPFQWCTKITAVSHGNQGAAVWAEFLKTITCGDDSLAGFLQQVAGMAAIGHVYHEGIVLASGSGRNGKSTLFNTLAGVLGTYAGSIDSTVLTTDRQNRGAALATLRGKRFIIAAELEEHQRLSTSTLKKLASTDKLTIEAKYCNPEEITQSHTLVLFTNHLPRVGSTDNGTWRRLTVIPFNAVIPENTAVQNLSDHLIEEAGPAIMSWMIDGAVNFTYNGFKLTIPDAVAEATEEYRTRENWLERFIDERCIREPNARVGARELYTAYNRALQDGWYDFVRERNTIQGELQEAIHKSYGALPEQVDQNAVALIQSGVLDAVETSGLFRRFEAENNTAMMRIIGRYASEQAEKTDKQEQRTLFLSTAQDAADSKGATLKSWDSLCEFATACLGAQPDLGTVTPSAAAGLWEENAGRTIEEF